MRDIIADSIERLLAARVTPKALREARDGVWDEALWRELEQAGFAHALGSGEADGASWSDLYPLLVVCGYHALPLPLPEAIAVNELIAMAGLEAPDGLVGLCDGEGRVAWGRRCRYVLAALPRDPDALALFPVAEAGLELGCNLAREPRDLMSFAEVAPMAVGRLEGAADQILLRGALIRVCQAAGAARKAIELTVRYAGERQQFGRPLAKFQAVQQQIAAAVSELAALNAASEFACGVDEAERPWAVAAAKIVAAEASDVVVEVAHAVHGAMGYTLEYPLHFATQRLISWGAEFGASSWWATRLGRCVLDHSRDDLAAVLVSENLNPLATHVDALS